MQSYPLEAVRDRERWKLEALQLRLATAALQQRALGDTHRSLVDAVGSAIATATATMSVGSIIDPEGAGRRLRSIERLQGAAASAGRAAETGTAACDATRLAVDAQRVRLESIERHRQAFQRRAAHEAERLQAIDAERTWLARSAWQARSENGSDRASAATSFKSEAPRP